MEFAELVEIIRDEPVFETGLLLSGDVKSADVRHQLSHAGIKPEKSISSDALYIVWLPHFKKYIPILFWFLTVWFRHLMSAFNRRWRIMG